MLKTKMLGGKKNETSVFLSYTILQLFSCSIIKILIIEWLLILQAYTHCVGYIMASPHNSPHHLLLVHQIIQLVKHSQIIVITNVGKTMS